MVRADEGSSLAWNQARGSLGLGVSLGLPRRVHNLYFGLILAIPYGFLTRTGRKPESRDVHEQENGR